MRVFQVDAFTAEPFAGNPAAVCILDDDRDERWMQLVGREMNLSETAFVRARDDGEHDLRWFTPTVEVDLCGHATLATAHVLWDEGLADTDLRFHTRSGALGASRDGAWIELDFPARPAVEGEVPDALVAACGGEPVVRARGEVGGGLSGYLLEYATADEVRALTPDFVRMASVPDGYVVVTAPGDGEGYDFVSRFFAPLAGIDEDPVTGSAHCTLGPWWAERLGTDEVVGFQVSARGGVVRCRPRGDRVLLGGQAVTVLRGRLGA